MSVSVQTFPVSSSSKVNKRYRTNSNSTVVPEQKGHKPTRHVVQLLKEVIINKRENANRLAANRSAVSSLSLPPPIPVQPYTQAPVISAPPSVSREELNSPIQDSLPPTPSPVSSLPSPNTPSTPAPSTPSLLSPISDVGSSSDPCSCTYRGSGPASEPEVQAIQNLAQDIASSLISSLSVHTTFYVWLSPYGYSRSFDTCNRPGDHDDIDQVGQAAIAAIESYSGDRWEAGTACEVLYAANGCTLDYMYSIGVKYSYTPELRGPGFHPPPSAIQPSFEEVWAGYLAMIAEIESIEAL